MSRGKKPRRHGDATLFGKIGHRLAPAPRYAVLLPLVDALHDPRAAASLLTPKVAGDGNAAAELIDQGGVAMLLLHPAIFRNIFGLSIPISAEFSSDDFPQSLRHIFSMAWKGETPAFKRECGARLRRAREARGYDSLRTFALDTQTDEDNLSNWERGVAQVPPSYISLLKRAFGIDHAWIYDEDASALPDDLRKALLTKDRRKQA